MAQFIERERPKDCFSIWEATGCKSTVLCSHNTPRFPRFDLIHPPADRHTIRNQLALLQVRYIIPYRLIQLWEWQEIEVLSLQLGSRLSTVKIHDNVSYPIAQIRQIETQS
jgi:hypothetical protein